MPWPRGEHDARGYLLDEYAARLRRHRREMARKSIRALRAHLRRWCVRIAAAGCEPRELDVRVLGADLLDLNELGAGERDLLAPLRDMKVMKGGDVRIVVHGEGFAPMEEGAKGWAVSVSNTRYAERVREAMMRGGGKVSLDAS